MPLTEFIIYPAVLQWYNRGQKYPFQASEFVITLTVTFMPLAVLRYVTVSRAVNCFSKPRVYNTNYIHSLPSSVLCPAASRWRNEGQKPFFPRLAVHNEPYVHTFAVRACAAASRCFGIPYTGDACPCRSSVFFCWVAITDAKEGKWSFFFSGGQILGGINRGEYWKYWECVGFHISELVGAVYPVWLHLRFPVPVESACCNFLSNGWALGQALICVLWSWGHSRNGRVGSVTNYSSFHQESLVALT